MTNYLNNLKLNKLNTLNKNQEIMINEIRNTYKVYGMPDSYPIIVLGKNKTIKIVLTPNGEIEKVYL